MSIAALNWAFAVPVEGPVKAVLVALANHANEACECWPNQERIALHSGFADRTVRKAIAELERLGLVVNSPSFYLIRVGVEIEKPAPRAARKARTNRHLVPTSGTPCQPIRHLVPEKPAPRASPIENHQEPPKEPPLNHQRQTALILPMAGGRASEPKGSRLREDWKPDATGIAFCREKGLDPASVFPKFQDYWLSASGERARKNNWSRAWQYWCRNEAERTPTRSNATPRVSAAQAARASHFAPPTWHDEMPTIDGDLVREFG